MLGAANDATRSAARETLALAQTRAKELAST